MRETKQFECRECGKPFERRILAESTSTRDRPNFCTAGCRTKWHNRRIKRGVQLYDFIMTMRYDRRHEREAEELLRQVARAARDSDKKHRDGRPSWRPFDEAKAELPLAFSASGDNR